MWLSDVHNNKQSFKHILPSGEISSAQCSYERGFEGNMNKAEVGAFTFQSASQIYDQDGGLYVV
jgi:hypothetical protein